MAAGVNRTNQFDPTKPISLKSISFSRLPPPLSLLSCGHLSNKLSNESKEFAGWLMGSYNDRSWSRMLRWAKTIYFLLTMLASLLLVCAPPLLVVLLDVLLPPVLLSASSNPSFSAAAFSSQLRSYKFQASLVDVPLVSVARSLLILCVYLVCEGRGPYLGITTVCSVGSIGFVSLKAAAMFGAETAQGRRLLAVGGKDRAAIEALFLSTMALAMAHIVVAYRTSCRERRKLLVHRIDIEAVKLKNVKI